MRQPLQEVEDRRASPKRFSKLIQLIHWKESEAQKRIAALGEKGFQIIYEIPKDQSFLKRMRETPPEVVIIDLDRLPSQGRDLGVAIRKSLATRHVLIVFVGGAPNKIMPIRELLPDALYSSWDKITGAIEDALHNPPKDPVVPGSVMAGYSGTPLPKKLGIKPGGAVQLIDPPPDFEETLGELPAGARLIVTTLDNSNDICDLVVRPRIV